MRKYFFLSLITFMILSFTSTAAAGETTITNENELTNWRVTMSPDYQEITSSTAKWKFYWSSGSGPFDVYFTPDKGMRSTWIGKYPSSGISYSYNFYSDSGPKLYYPSVRVIDYNGILAVGEAIVYKRP